ncbi:MAG: MFS transporter [Lachnospirales bacterium]
MKNNTKFSLLQIRYIILGFLLMLFSGLVNAWSIFAEPIEMDLNIMRKDTSWVFAISMSVSILGQFLSSNLNKVISNKYIYCLIALFSVVGFYGTSVSNNIYSIYIFYGVFAGLTIGMIYNLCMSTLLPFFNDNANFVIGILLMGFGIGPLLLGTPLSYSINYLGWRKSFVILCVLYLLLLLNSAIFLPSYTNNKRYVETYTQVGVTTEKMLKDKYYWIFFLSSITIACTILTLVGHSSLISSDLGLTYKSSTLMTGILAISSGGARPFFGSLADKCNCNVQRNFLSFFSILGSVFLYLGYKFNLLPLMIVAYILIGLANACSAVYVCAFLTHNYGNKYFGVNMAFTNIYMILGSIFAATAGAIKQYTGYYTFAIVLMVTSSLITGILNIILNKKNRRSYVKTKF